MKLFNQKYKFFKRKIRDVQYAIWEAEFKIAKSREVREGVRLDRDRAVEAMLKVDEMLKGDLKKEEREALEAELKKLSDNKERYEKQMKMIDDQINGGEASEMNPTGAGLIEVLKGYVELQGMYKKYLKQC